MSVQPARPLGNVLVATDFSPGGARAVTRAALLPTGPGSSLTILHVLPPGGATRRDARTEARHGLAQAASAARAVRRERDVFPQLVDGRPFAEIVRLARHVRAQVIVVGRHGAGTFRDLLLGSTAERIVRHGDRSVLVVGAPPAGPYRHALVAVDLSDISRWALDLALRLADPGLTLEVIHVYGIAPDSAIRRAGISPTDARQYHLDARTRTRAAVERFLASQGEVARGARVILRRGDARRMILDSAAARGPDLLTVGTHGRSGLARALLGSVAEAVVRGAPCDVLVARPPGAPIKLP